jgi:D-alanine-D-alanine ligase
LDKSVVIVSLAGEESEPIPQYWGDPSVVGSVRQVLDAAEIECLTVTAKDPSDLVSMRSPKNLFFPNGRYFRPRRVYLSALFDHWRLSYVGSSRVGHENESKIRMKSRLLSRGVPTPDFRTIYRDQDLEMLTSFPTPYVLKPDAGTESFGVIRVDSARDAPEVGRHLLAQFGRPLIAETWSRAREFTVALIGNRAQWYAFPVEIVVPHEVGYLTEGLKLAGAIETTAPVTAQALRKRLAAIAVAAADCLIVRDCVRMEILMDGAGELFVIDVNTLPGLRPGPHHQSYQLSCLAANLGFGQAETVLSIIASAARRLGLPQSRRLTDVWSEVSRGRTSRRDI